MKPSYLILGCVGAYGAAASRIRGDSLSVTEPESVSKPSPDNIESMGFRSHQVPSQAVSAAAKPIVLRNEHPVTEAHPGLSAEHDDGGLVFDDHSAEVHPDASYEDVELGSDSDSSDDENEHLELNHDEQAENRDRLQHKRCHDPYAGSSHTKARLEMWHWSKNCGNSYFSHKKIKMNKCYTFEQNFRSHREVVTLANVHMRPIRQDCSVYVFDQPNCKGRGITRGTLGSDWANHCVMRHHHNPGKSVKFVCPKLKKSTRSTASERDESIEADEAVGTDENLSSAASGPSIDAGGDTNVNTTSTSTETPKTLHKTIHVTRRTTSGFFTRTRANPTTTVRPETTSSTVNSSSSSNGADQTATVYSTISSGEVETVYPDNSTAKPSVSCTTFTPSSITASITGAPEMVS